MLSVRVSRNTSPSSFFVSMKIKCPACSKVLNIPDSAAGKIVKCPCGKQLRAPGSAPQGLASSAPAGAKPGESRPASGNPAATRPVAGPGEFDAAMFDDLTDQDLKPVKGVVNPYTPVASPAAGGGNVLKQYSPRDGVGGQGRREIAGVGSRILARLSTPCSSTCSWELASARCSQSCHAMAHNPHQSSSGWWL